MNSAEANTKTSASRTRSHWPLANKLAFGQAVWCAPIGPEDSGATTTTIALRARVAAVPESAQISAKICQLCWSIAIGQPRTNKLECAANILSATLSILRHEPIQMLILLASAPAPASWRRRAGAPLRFAHRVRRSKSIKVRTLARESWGQGTQVASRPEDAPGLQGSSLAPADWRQGRIRQRYIKID